MLRRAPQNGGRGLAYGEKRPPADFAVTNAIREPQADTPDHPGEPIR
ncbi:hypothetical protein [Dickeya solani]|uniref:Uncharacterized protein n=1 Tax=Dickeya solani TaxID=1089444 RepID=A0AAX4F194_9GAMM|nr:hypothetical protein [Dickeya solani]WOA53378.1 hypothetical protein RXA29_03805 [Dickeya solani]